MVSSTVSQIRKCSYTLTVTHNIRYLKSRTGLATTLADRRRLDLFDMRCQRRLLRVFWQQHVSNQSIRERTRQPTASSLLRQRRLRWFGNLHRMPASLPVRRVFTSTLPSMVGRDQEAAPKPDGRTQSNTTSILLASTPSMPPSWYMTDPSGRPLFADCQRSNPIMALKSSKFTSQALPLGEISWPKKTR